MSYDSDYHAGESVGQFVSLDQREVGDWRNGEIVLRATGPVRDHLRGPGGGMRTGALLAVSDNACGFTAGLASLPDGWVVSTNLALRRFRIETVGPIRIEADVTRRGRRAVITSGSIYDDGAAGALVGEAVLTSAVLVPENGVPEWERPARLIAHQLPDPANIVEAFGIRPAGEGDPYVWLDLREQLRNPWGFVHGGVTATLVDVATERAVRHASGAGMVITMDVTMHYLAPGRVGPLKAAVRLLGERPDGYVARIEVTDEGARGRTCAVAAATARPAE